MTDRDKVVDIIRSRAKTERMYALAALAIILIISFAVTWWFLYLAAMISYNDQASAIMGVVNTAILRLGSVAVSLYIISILFNFSRNRFRLHDALNARADLLMLYSGDFDDLTGIFKIICVDQIEFDKEPVALHEKALDIVREAIKKIPTGLSK